MFTEVQIAEIKEYLNSVSDDSKIYLGVDSQKFRKRGKWFARYTGVLVVHIDNSKGCKVFGYSEVEDDFDPVKKPRMRLMNECYKVAEMYLAFGEELELRDVEVHLDLNKDEMHQSNHVVTQAMGYIKGVCQLPSDNIKIKPEAFAASYAADHHVRYGGFEISKRAAYTH